MFCYNEGKINFIMNPIDTNRIANALERIAQALEHFNIEHAHIDEIDVNLAGTFAADKFIVIVNRSKSGTTKKNFIGKK